jgi:hypothetical protein
MDNFTVAVLIGGAVVLAIFIAMMILDKKYPDPGTKN